MTQAKQLEDIHARLKRGEALSDEDKAILDSADVEPEYFPTLQAIAQRYGIRRSALDRWRKVYPEGFEQTEQGYSAAGVKEARKRFLKAGKNVRLCKGDIENIQDKPAAPPTEEFEDLETLKARKLTLECRKLANQNELFHHLYVPKAKVEREAVAVFYGLKEALLRIGGEVCYQVSGKTPAEAKEIINDAIRRVLEKAKDIDFAKFEASISIFGEAPPKKTRAPAIRKTNGRQKAS